MLEYISGITLDLLQNCSCSIIMHLWPSFYPAPNTFLVQIYITIDTIHILRQTLQTSLFEPAWLQCIIMTWDDTQTIYYDCFNNILTMTCKQWNIWYPPRPKKIVGGDKQLAKRQTVTCLRAREEKCAWMMCTLCLVISVLCMFCKVKWRSGTSRCYRVQRWNWSLVSKSPGWLTGCTIPLFQTPLLKAGCSNWWRMWRHSSRFYYNCTTTSCQCHMSVVQYLYYSTHSVR